MKSVLRAPYSPFFHTVAAQENTAFFLCKKEKERIYFEKLAFPDNFSIGVGWNFTMDKAVKWVLASAEEFNKQRKRSVLPHLNLALHEKKSDKRKLLGIDQATSFFCGEEC